jgi:hypothetical protein
MKNFLSISVAAILASSALAGNMGPGPWANGAYYPNQFNGVYSASMYNDQTQGGTMNAFSPVVSNRTAFRPPTVISGLIGFGIRGGGQSISSNTAATATIASQVDPAQNYWAAFINGATYVGTTIANINGQAKRVSGALANGVAPGSTYQRIVIPEGFADFEPTVLTVSNTFNASGAFSAKLVSDDAVVRFKGEDTGIITYNTQEGSSNAETIPTATVTFSVDGMKTGN